MKSIAFALMCMFVLMGCAPTYGYGTDRSLLDRERAVLHARWERPTNQLLR
jgi:hypothetical protein